MAKAGPGNTGPACKCLPVASGCVHTYALKLLVYLRGPVPASWVRREAGVLCLHGLEQIRAVACFRPGDHWPGVQRQRLPRPGCMDDELHVLYCPADMLLV